MLDPSENEYVTWFPCVLKDWIGSGYMEQSVSSVLQPLLLLLVFLLLIYCLALGILICYACTFYLYIWKKQYNIHGDICNELWSKPRRIMANILDLYGKIWHGYEIIGMEHLPEGPGLIVFYHGAMVFDFAFFVAKFYANTGRLVHSVIHCFFHLIPGIKLFFKVTGCIEGNQANCVELLKKGHLVGIAPGGLREQNFSDENYNLEWGTRTGFAQVALKSKVPIIPLFTQNLREAYRTVGKTRLSRWLYEHFKLLVLPIYGGFPVKLRTYIGEPIPYDPNVTAKELAEKTKIAMENLRDRYQKRPGNILRALLERFDKNEKDA
ncbi:DGAT1/2-independent enzyme synthesizing storage lipids-like [Candoia aspera]|uniref:DGAT1/2-independent enzyme synthesizing storage lipids-like n=1 Tax=Candoia aspera TaxID=51853 RepID=UPI002FD7A0AA